MTPALQGIFLGHAGFFLQYGEVKIAMDPWFNPQGAFYGSWHQWPDNSAVPAAHPEIFSPTHIWLSHEHADHFDESYLARADKNAVILLPKFPSKNMQKRLQELGYSKFETLDHLASSSLCAEVTATMLIEEPSYTEHSSLHLQCGTLGIFHNSDSSFAVPTLEKIAAQLHTDVYIGQYSVTSPFPNVMEWPEAEKTPHRTNHLTWSLGRFAHGVQYLRAKHAIPCAGPALVLHPAAAAITRQEIADENGGYDDAKSFARILALVPGTEICPMLPGSTFHITPEGISYKKPALPNARERLALYDVAATARHTEANAVMPSADIEIIRAQQQKSFARARKLCPMIMEQLGFVFSVYFTDLDMRIEIDFAAEDYAGKLEKGRLTVVNCKEPTYQIALHSHLWADFLDETSHTMFDDINYGQRFTVSQNEGGFSSDFIVLLRALHDTSLLTAVNRDYLARSDATITLMFENQPYEIKRFCPHLGIDLSGHVPDENGIITCKGHGWRFDVKTGACVFGDSAKNIACPHQKPTIKASAG